MEWSWCPEPRCLTELMPETPENAFSSISGKSFRKQTIIPFNTDTMAFDSIGDYVGGKVHHFCNEDHEFVKVSVPGKY